MNKWKYRVELEDGVWIAFGVGDPPRALQIENAAQFGSYREAEIALKEARRHRPFNEAWIEAFDTGLKKE